MITKFLDVSAPMPILDKIITGKGPLVTKAREIASRVRGEAVKEPGKTKK